MGMNRTGVETARLYDFIRAIGPLQALRFSGLHCYDGHVHTADLLEREAEVAEMVASIADALDRLEAVGTEIPAIIAGGSPSFPCHAANPDVFLSPGTVFLWDAGYSAAYPDLPFTPAAAVLTRVVSHPADGIFTLDLGCKGIASDPAGPRGPRTCRSALPERGALDVPYAARPRSRAPGDRRRVLRDPDAHLPDDGTLQRGARCGKRPDHRPLDRRRTALTRLSPAVLPPQTETPCALRSAAGARGFFIPP